MSSLLLRKTLNNIPIKYFFSTTIEKRPFRILGLQQIAIGSLKKDDLSMFWENLLGIEKIGTYQSNKENVDEDILKLGKGLNSIEIDLMQPINPDVSPKVHIPALNHIGLWVDNLSIAYSYLENKGIKFTPGGIRKGASGYDVAFIHPKSAVGVLVELVQAPPDVINHLK